MSWCNRILFLPRNRHLMFYARRAWLRGHWPRFKKVDLDDGWRMPYFDDEHKMKHVYRPKFEVYFREWVKYFAKKRCDYLVVDRETNIEINAACKAAKLFRIPVVYIMHGSDIFDLPEERRKLVDDYDYLYLPNTLNAEYFRGLKRPRRAQCHRFNRWVPDLRNLPTEVKKVMYVPMFNHDEEFVERSGCRLSNEKRYEYNRKFLHAFEIHSGHYDFYWCHDPRLDRVKNEMDAWLDPERENLVKWLKGPPPRYFGKMDLIITDVGSTVFFEALGAGKPVVCLRHSDSLPIKARAEHYFGDCLQSFHSHFELGDRLRGILKDPLSHMPWNYVEEEINRPNDELVWEL